MRRWLDEEAHRAAAHGLTMRHDPNRHDRDIRAFCLTFERPFDWTAFGIWLTMLLHAHGERVLRVKGILNVLDLATPVVIHGVQHVIHPPAHLERWPDRRPALAHRVHRARPRAAGDRALACGIQPPGRSGCARRLRSRSHLMRPKVVLISTGGTIASRFDRQLGRTVASQRGEDLLAQVPQLAEIAELEVDDFATVPSFDMSVEFAFALGGRINQQLARDDVAGVVVTHGTDTMEESCYLADLLLRSDKPAVFTGAQRAARRSEPRRPGQHSRRGAHRRRARGRAGLGAVICFADQIHAARDVTKVSASALATFQSYDKGALGEVDAGRVVIHRRPERRRTFTVERLETRVPLLRLYLGFDVALVEAALERGAKGLVLEAFGRGNGPAALVPVVRAAVAAGVRW